MKLLRKTACLAVALMPLAALAGGNDIFGRTDSGYNAEDAAYAADPFDPQPRFWMRHAQEVTVVEAFPAEAPSTAEATYYQSAPFDPLPQFWARRNGAASVRDQDAADSAHDGSRRDVFGRPYASLSATDRYFLSDPYDPLPQFWQRTVAASSASESGTLAIAGHETR